MLVAAAAVVLAAVVAVSTALTGSTTGPREDRAGGGGAHASASTGGNGKERGNPSARPDSRSGSDSGSSSGSGSGSGAKATPKVPAAELTPATGSFTEKEKKYLIGRVPEGLDPAAVLEAGNAACARIGATAGASEKDAVSALRAGEIDNAAPAVRHLCPEFAPLLKKAGRGE